jgi:hypothetical protein
VVLSYWIHVGNIFALILFRTHVRQLLPSGSCISPRLKGILRMWLPTSKPFPSVGTVAVLDVQHKLSLATPMVRDVGLPSLLGSFWIYSRMQRAMLRYVILPHCVSFPCCILHDYSMYFFSSCRLRDWMSIHFMCRIFRWIKLRSSGAGLTVPMGASTVSSNYIVLVFVSLVYSIGVFSCPWLCPAAYMSSPCHIELMLSEKEEPVKKEVCSLNRAYFSSITFLCLNSLSDKLTIDAHIYAV